MVCLAITSSSAAISAGVSYTCALVVAEPKSHTTQVPSGSISTFSALRSLGDSSSSSSNDGDGGSHSRSGISSSTRKCGCVWAWVRAARTSSDNNSSIGQRKPSALLDRISSQLPAGQPHMHRQQKHAFTCALLGASDGALQPLHGTRCQKCV